MQNSNLDLAVLENKNLATTVEASKGIAEIQASLLIAKSFPRNEIACIEKIKTTCQRQKLAEKSLYQYARGGTSIEGASIRLAEVLANTWGNIDYGYKVLETEKEYSKVEAFAWDKETNAKRSTVFDASHFRTARGARNLLTDDRDIYEMVANLASRRVRACILAIIPFDIQEVAIEECKKTMVSKANINDKTIKDMLTAFEKFGVTKPMIEKRIQRKIIAIEPAQFLNLGNIYNSMKDGIATLEDFFEKDAIDTTLDLSNMQEATQAPQPTAPVSKTETFAPTANPEKKASTAKPKPSILDDIKNDATQAEQPYRQPSIVQCPKNEEEVLDTMCGKCNDSSICPNSPHFETGE